VSAFASAPAPTPTPHPLTESEAIALVKDELAARDVGLDTVRIKITSEPRVVAIRYTSTYDLSSSVFRAQTILVGLALSRAVMRIEPPIRDGINLSVLPEGNAEVGLVAITISQSNLDAWADGFISDEVFVANWAVGTVPKE
jgi:hypothetical protein